MSGGSLRERSPRNMRSVSPHAKAIITSRTLSHHDNTVEAAAFSLSFALPRRCCLEFCFMAGTLPQGVGPSPTAYNVVSKQRVGRRFGFDLLVAWESSVEYRDWTDFFQQVRLEPGQRKGILRVRL